MKSKKQKLSFKLWSKNIVRDIKTNISSYQTTLNKVFAIIIALLGLYLAFTANKLADQGNKYSEAALNLSKKDNTQQIQIDKLSEILLLQKNQIDTLVEIATELKQLNEYTRNQISQLNDQKNLLAENSQPLLKDIDYRFIPKEGIDFTKKIDFIFIVKNFGQRPAYNMSSSVIFVKLNGSKVESHGKQSSNDLEKYQSTLYPGEEQKYEQVTNFSHNGLKDIESLVAVFRFTYYDKPLKRTETTTFYYEHSILTNDSYSIKTARPEIKKIVDSYLHLKKI